MLNVDQVQLATFQAVVEQGSFEAAARALHVTPSAVSQRIKARETAVGKPVWESHRLLHQLDDSDSRFFVDEFVKDRANRDPDGAQSLAVVNRMRERRVLISAAGIHGNTLKIRPPLPFGKNHADIVLKVLEEVLHEMN